MQALRQRYYELYPNSFFLDMEDGIGLQQYLRMRGWITRHQELKLIEKPGAGNMNCILRIRLTDGKSFIIKQSRPWVEKFPHIPAPEDRIQSEINYYDAISNNALLLSYSPNILYHDSMNHVMILEDLGESADLSGIYHTSDVLDEDQIFTCVSYLNALQHVEIPKGYPLNIKMRVLNHEHIFDLPFDPSNLFPLDDIQHGLKKRAKSITDNNSIKEKVNQLGKIYLSKGGTLCHGDFYPGSIMITKRHGLRVIDPEFSFPGPKEWDLAVFVAHLYLAQTHISLIQKALDLFTSIDDLDESLFWGFVGTEIIRRLIGLAQLPLELTLQQKEDLLQQACLFILK